MASVRLYRIVHRKYAADPFSGKGGLYAASRWASRGQLVSYAADSLALAALEKIAGAGRLTRMQELMYATAELDPAGAEGGAIYAPDQDDLPDNWNQRPAGKASHVFGDTWLREGTSVAMRVPSVVLPSGWNYILNPAHSDFNTALTIHASQSLNLDPRVLARLQSDAE